MAPHAEELAPEAQAGFARDVYAALEPFGFAALVLGDASLCRTEPPIACVAVTSAI